MLYFLGDVITSKIQSETPPPLLIGYNLNVTSADRGIVVVNDRISQPPTYHDAFGVRYATQVRTVYAYCIPSLVVYGLLSNLLTCAVLWLKQAKSQKEE
jgi:hypothetical protein